MILAELHDKEPLIIRLINGCTARGEPVYMALGSLRYYLQRVEYIPPADWADGDYWRLTFSESKNSLPTQRRVTNSNADSWHLEKQVNPAGDIRWEMTENNEWWAAKHAARGENEAS